MLEQVGKLSKDYYVLLTGSKNNAGDYLIKYRAKQLFSTIRPDREIIDYNAWIELDSNQLEVINKSKALILMGGPALQFDMRPRVYPLVKNIKNIKVPVITMGIGYKSHDFSWDYTSRYQLNKETLELLDKINASGYISSVRDYRTLNVLLKKGFTNFTMTGCPALYDLACIGQEPVMPSEIRSIGFSLGFSYKVSPLMTKMMKRNILSIRESFKSASLTVFFHHTIDRSDVIQQSFLKWLEKNEVNYQDISKSAEALIEAYSNADLHIGYRVHSHIFCCSISKPSWLIAEDSRAVALRNVIGGCIVDSYEPTEVSMGYKLKKKLGINFDEYKPLAGLDLKIIASLHEELKKNFPSVKTTRKSIDAYFIEMKDFLMQLP